MSESPTPPKPVVPKDPGLDAAQQSLADALRVSFNVLKVVMVLLIVVYICSGVFRVDEQNRAIRLRFGQPVGQSEYAPGWHFGLPYPLEEVIQVPRNEQKLRVDSAFWYDNPDNRTPEQLANQPINPLRDGFLITGDTNIIHVQFELGYVITNVQDYLANVGSLEKAQEIVQTASERGMLHAVAGVSVEAIVNRGEYPSDTVKRRTQEVLDDLRAGITIQQVLIDREKQSMPPAVRQAYLEVTNAQGDKATSIQGARQAYNQRLNSTAGAAHRPLYQMIRAYDDALERGDESLSALIRTEIDRSLTQLQLAPEPLHTQVQSYLASAGQSSTLDEAELGEVREALVSALNAAAALESAERVGPRITGEAAYAVNDAITYQTTIVQEAQQQYARYASNLAQYRQTPQLITHELWQGARERVMAGMVETIYAPGGQIRINEARDPLVVQDMAAYELEQRREERRQNRANEGR